MLLQDFLVHKSAMRFLTVKTFAGIAIGVIAVSAIFLISLFVTTPTVQDSAIPSPLESGNLQLQVKNLECEPIVFAMDADGEIYFGKNPIGNVASAVDLTASVKRSIEQRASLLAYSRGMDLNDEIPLRCTDEPVYIKTVSPGDNARLEILSKVFRELGVSPLRVIDRRKPPATMH